MPNVCLLAWQLNKQHTSRTFAFTYIFVAFHARRLFDLPRSHSAGSAAGVRRRFIKSVVRFLFHAEIFNLDFKCVLPRRNPRPAKRPLTRSNFTYCRSCGTMPAPWKTREVRHECQAKLFMVVCLRQATPVLWSSSPTHGLSSQLFRCDWLPS